MFSQFLEEELLLLEELKEELLTLMMKLKLLGIKDTAKTVCTGVEMFRKLLG